MILMIPTVLYDLDAIRFNKLHFDEFKGSNILNIIRFIIKHKMKMTKYIFSKGATSGGSPIVNSIMIANDSIK